MALCLAQAEQSLERLKETVGVHRRSLNKVEQTRQMLQVAAEVVQLRAEGDRVAENQLAQGVILVSAPAVISITCRSLLARNRSMLWWTKS